MLKRKFMMGSKDLNFKISPVQLKILHYLLMHSKDIVFQRDIEKAIDYRRSTISGILNTMEKNNLIKRVDSKIDARLKQIVLTDYSIEISNYMIEQKNKLELNLKKNITEEELKLFFEVTEKIKNNIINMNEK